MTDDIFARTRALFELPEGVVYLDGNSLGPLPTAVRERVLAEIDQGWGERLIRGWNERGWIDLQLDAGNRIARLIGAPEDSVVAADSTSVNLFKVLTAALGMAGDRKIVLSDSGNFPTDLYVAQGAVEALGRGHELKIVAPEEIETAITADVAVLMITQVDYRTGRLHDMAALTAKAHEQGVITIWDLCHSAGALPVDLAGCNVDFAIGCGYKYLNGGPGAPAFLYVRPDHADRVSPSLSGWMGHEAPFAFDLDYRPARGIDRMRVGTPAILSLAALHTALEVWDGVDMNALRRRSIVLSERFIKEVEARCPELELASPRDPSVRGSQVSFRFREGYAAVQALIANGVIGDFRAPDIMRFGFTPLYISEADVVTAAQMLERVMRENLWDRPEFRMRSKVT
ncbi:kynureninase [Mesorhizobium sp. WSM2239]|uniref:Kynureninase n=2 Tax=unclassified Mesorhizobium TaxID=325217 RepID=A0AAU8D0T7_9HYPH